MQFNAEACEGQGLLQCNLSVFLCAKAFTSPRVENERMKLTTI